MKWEISDLMVNVIIKGCYLNKTKIFPSHEYLKCLTD